MSPANGYPACVFDGGPLLPTTTGLICGKCHKVTEAPDFNVLRAAREAHRAAGEGPIALDRRPAPEAVGVHDLTPPERKTMCSVHAGRLKHLSDDSVASLVRLGLLTEYPGIEPGKRVREVTMEGRRVAALCAAAQAQTDAAPLLLFDLGEQDPERLRRANERKAAEARRRKDRGP